MNLLVYSGPNSLYYCNLTTANSQNQECAISCGKPGNSILRRISAPGNENSGVYIEVGYIKDRTRLKKPSKAELSNWMATK